VSLGTNADFLCTVPRALRLFIPTETPEQIAVCQGHDLAYNNGGSERQRAVADAKLLLGLLETGMDVEQAERYYLAVRLGGKRHWRDGRYTDE
jgi:hypothetical protein